MDPIWILLAGMLVVVGSILWLRLHAFLALLLGAFVVGGLTSREALQQYAVEREMPPAEVTRFANRSVGERIGLQFGQTAGSIGILIGLASIIGRCLMESGAADRIVRSALRLLGEPRAPLAFLSSGFVLGIPIFFDTVFLLMIPLGKAMWKRTGRNYLLYVLTIIAGATMTHSLVPPTPGPLFVASELKVDLGLMILGGCVVGTFTALAGCLYAYWMNRRIQLPVRELAGDTAVSPETALREDWQLPSLGLSLLPILLPVVLIGGSAVIGSAFPAATASTWATVLKTVGNPNIALAISCAIAMLTLVRQRGDGLVKLAPGIQSALAEAGIIILITSAGGAFGGLLQQSGIGPRIQELSSASQIGILPMAFLVTALVRVAQGSATVAMITGVGMFAAMGTAEQLGFHPVYLALAIGCGSKPLPWMNDSGFWVVCKMSGMTEREALMTYSPLPTLMGIVGLIVTMILARAFPLV